MYKKKKKNHFNNLKNIKKHKIKNNLKCKHKQIEKLDNMKIKYKI